MFKRNTGIIYLITQTKCRQKVCPTARTKKKEQEMKKKKKNQNQNQNEKPPTLLLMVKM